MLLIASVPLGQTVSQSREASQINGKEPAAEASRRLTRRMVVILSPQRESRGYITWRARGESGTARRPSLDVG